MAPTVATPIQAGRVTRPTMVKLVGNVVAKIGIGKGGWARIALLTAFSALPK